MIGKKIFFILTIFLFFCSFANAIVVNEISEQIEQGNKEIIANNAKIKADVSALKTQISELQSTLSEVKNDQLTKDDVGIIRYNIDQAMAIWQQQVLIMLLFLIAFAFAGFLFGKNKGWF